MKENVFLCKMPDDPRDLRGVPGVYKITNILNDNCYVGSTEDLYRRCWTEHAGPLHRGNHSNKHLQSAWNKYGESNFRFDVLTKCLPGPEMSGFLEDNENFFIRQYAQGGRAFPAYNNKPDAKTMRGFTFTLREDQKGHFLLKRKPVERIDPITGEVKEYDGAVCAERDDGFSASSIRKVCKGKTNTHAGFFWQYLRASDKEKVSSEKKKRTYKTKPIKRIDPVTGSVKCYFSLNEAKRDGFDKKHIADVCKGKARTHAGFMWQFTHETDLATATIFNKKQRIYSGTGLERINASTGEVKEYASAKIAKLEGFNTGGISNACNGKVSKYRGYFWQYQDTN